VASNMGRGWLTNEDIITMSCETFSYTSDVVAIGFPRMRKTDSLIAWKASWYRGCRWLNVRPRCKLSWHLLRRSKKIVCKATILFLISLAGCLDCYPILDISNWRCLDQRNVWDHVFIKVMNVVVLIKVTTIMTILFYFSVCFC